MVARHPWLVLVAAIMLAPLGCGCGDRCGDLRRVGDRCADPSVASDARAEGVATDADPAPDGGADVAATDDAVIHGLGTPCSASSPCTEDADYCAIQPGASSGYCSVTGCQPSDPGSSPAGYYCFDLSIFGAGMPTFCARK